MSRGPRAGVAIPSRSRDDRAREASARAAVSCGRDPAPAGSWGWPSSRSWWCSTKSSRPKRTNWKVPIRIGATLLVYALASWVVLRLFFEKAKPFANLGTVFLALDIPAFVWVIYQTGAEQQLAVLPALHPRRRSDQHDVQAGDHLQPRRGRQLPAADPVSGVRRAPSDLVAGRSVQAADPVRRQPVRVADRTDRRADARADGGGDPVRARHGVEAADPVAGARGGAAAGRGVEPYQERVPREHEPRDPDADERHHGHDRAAARHRPERGSARVAARWCERRPSRCCASSTTSSMSRRSKPAG